MVIACGVLLIIHRHVISACITGEQMPEPPEWHKKCMPFLSWDKGGQNAE